MTQAIQSYHTLERLNTGQEQSWLASIALHMGAVTLENGIQVRLAITVDRQSKGKDWG